MYEVLDLVGPHMDHSIEKLKTHKRFIGWLNGEIEKVEK